MRCKYLLPILLLVFACAACGRYSVEGKEQAGRKPSKARSVALDFDGGFAYLMSGSKIDVAGVRPVANIMEHRLRIGVANAALYDPKATTIQPEKAAAFLAWDLTGYDAVIAPGGTSLAGAGVKVPAEGNARPACGNLPVGSDLGNRLQYLLDLAALHPTATLNEANIASTLSLTDGEFQIRKAGHCWQLERGQEKRRVGRLVRGITGMNYRVGVDAPYVDIKLAKRGTKAYTETIRLLPGPDGVVAARVSTMFNDMVSTVKPGELDTHFRMFYALLEFRQARASLTQTADAPFDARFIVDTAVSPGDDCLSVRYTRPSPSASRTLQ
jgi:hypothetical protein